MKFAGSIIGFIGLGNMGGGMAECLLEKGFSVIGYDTETRRVNELESAGLTKAETIENIAKQCDVVVLCLPNPDISREVITKHLLVADRQMSLVIETSTLTPEVVTEFAEMFKQNNCAFISAPMIGGKGHASTGSIEFLVEGEKAVSDECAAIFEAMGTVRFMGDIPSATLAKLAFNLSRYANLAVGVETYRLLEKYSANIPAVYEFMSEQSLDNFGQVWREDLKEMMTTNVPFKPSQVPKKDLALLSEMAKQKELSDELIQSIRNTYLSME